MLVFGDSSFKNRFSPANGPLSVPNLFGPVVMLLLSLNETLPKKIKRKLVAEIQENVETLVTTLTMTKCKGMTAMNDELEILKNNNKKFTGK